MNTTADRAARPSSGEPAVPDAELITDIVPWWAERAPEHPALVEASGSWTYRELHDAAGRMRDALAGAGIGPGDRVMLVGENCRALVACFLGALALGAWPTIANPRLSDREIEAIQSHSQARRVLYTTGVSPRARSHAALAGAVALDDMGPGQLAIGPRDDAAVAEPIAGPPAERVAALVYTSGTTGQPKGVMLTHRNLLFTARVSGRLRGIHPPDHVYAVLPFSHILGLAGVLLGTLVHGGTVYLTPRFDPAATLAALRRDRLTLLLGTPSMFALMLDYARGKGLETLRPHDLRLISSAGAPLAPGSKEQIERLFGLPLYNGYGVTECSPTVSQTWLGEERPDISVGRVLPGLEVRLLDPDGAPVAPGAVGELFVRGPNVMKGYYRDPVATAAVIGPDGSFRTGDLARFEGAHLFIVGRAKELIIRFGFNVYPPEVEAVLNAHPDVVHSAVVGRAVEGDEEIVAFVQLSPGSTTTVRDLADHAARELAPYKQPSEIRLVDELPTSAPGKIRKVDLVKLAASPVARAT
jgi:acyl-CoA synthetase (AMP-forming)/AMP-acid ligase II